MIKRIAIVAGLVVLVALLALLLRGVVREMIVIPMLQLFWMVRVLIESIPQAALWAGLLILLLILAWTSLVKPTPPPRLMRQTQKGSSRTPVASWAALFERAAIDEYGRHTLAQRLVQLTSDVLSSEEQGPEMTLWERLRDPTLDIPPDVRAYLNAGIRPARTAPTFWQQVRAFIKRTPPEPSDLDLDPELTLRYLEQRLHRE
jgi:hypothetical protein